MIWHPTRFELGTVDAQFGFAPADGAKEMMLPAATMALTMSFFMVPPGGAHVSTHTQCYLHPGSGCRSASTAVRQAAIAADRTALGYRRLLESPR